MTRSLQTSSILLLSVLSASGLGASASAQEAPVPASAKKPAPVFQASGLQGNTAPSGYAGGAAEAYSANVATLASVLQARDLARMTRAEQAGGDKLRMAVLDALKAKNYKIASDSIERLLAMETDSADAHKLQGMLDAALGGTSDAIAAFDEAARLDPTAANLNSAGLARLAYSTPGAAQTAFRSAVGLHPESAELWLGLGLSAQLAGQPVEAREALLKATSNDATRRLAFTLLALETGVEATWNARLRSIMEPLVQPDPSDAILDYDYAMLLGKAGYALTKDEARNEKKQQLERAVKAQPGFAVAHYELGVMAAEAGDVQTAAEEFGKAILLDDAVPEWHYRLSRAERRLNKMDEADRELRRFQELKAQPASLSEGQNGLLQGLPLQELIR